MNVKLFSGSAVATLALSLFVAACGDEGALVGQEAGGDVEKSIRIADARGRAIDVLVVSSETTPAGTYLVVEADGRRFELAQWTDARVGAVHGLVASMDGSLRYEVVSRAGGAQLVLTDASGERTIEAGRSMGSVDETAAALLMSMRGTGSDEMVPYAYRTWCVGYDTSDPDDWHLVVGRCTCDHWYSIICTMDQ